MSNSDKGPEPVEEAGGGRAGEAEAARGEPSRPFRLVKYFSYTGFVVILFFALALTIFISRQAQSLIIQKSEDYALVVADNLNHQVFIQFVLPAAMQYGRIRLRDPEQFELLDAVVRNTIHSFNVTRVNLFDLEGQITYSTEKELIGAQGRESPPYLRALEGETSSSVVSEPGEGLEGLAGLQGSRYMRTFYPFRGEKPALGAVGDILGVFEIHQDLTADYTANRKFMYISIAISLVFTSLLFIILRKILMRGEGIIEQRNAERRRLEEKLHQSERLASLGQMVAGVAHEIRNPLGIISSTAEMLQSKLQDDDQKAHLADVIVEESRRLGGVVSEFLDFARPETPALEDCSLIEILEANLNFLALEMERLGIRVEKDFQGPGAIQGDRDLLYRAFFNILLNAIQAMPDGGVLTVAAARPYGPDGRELGVVQASISDTGPGIDPVKARELFTPFFTTKSRGSGLGLSIVKNIVEAHRGDVVLEPAGGRGTTVVVTLPVRQE